VHASTRRRRRTELSRRLSDPPANGTIAIDNVSNTVSVVNANGEIALAMPEGTSAQLSASVANGGIDVFGLDIQGESRTATTLSGTLGNGRGTIALNVGNGTITISGT
jgi:hypothetical protein